MKVGEIWIEKKTVSCPICPDSTVKVKITKLKEDKYGHSLYFTHSCTGTFRELFNGNGYGDVVEYKYLEKGYISSMPREAFLLVWEPYENR